MMRKGFMFLALFVVTMSATPSYGVETSYRKVRSRNSMQKDNQYKMHDGKGSASLSKKKKSVQFSGSIVNKNPSVTNKSVKAKDDTIGESKKKVFYPTISPTMTPTTSPSMKPSVSPSTFPSTEPTSTPSSIPSSTPSKLPTSPPKSSTTNKAKGLKSKQMF